MQSLDKIMSPMNRHDYFSIWMLLFYLPNCPGESFWCCIELDKGIPVLFLRTFTPLIFGDDVNYSVLTGVLAFSSILFSGNIFLMKECWILSSSALTESRKVHTLLSSVNVEYCVDFLYAKSSYFVEYFSWPWPVILLIHLHIVSSFIRNISLKFSLLEVSLSGFGIRAVLLM